MNRTFKNLKKKAHALYFISLKRDELNVYTDYRKLELISWFTGLTVNMQFNGSTV